MLNRSPSSLAEFVKSREPSSRAPRVRVTMPAGLELAPGYIAKATILDVSRSGFRLTCDTPLKVGQSVTMHLPRETVSCEVRWVDGNEVGGAFSDKAEGP